MASQRVTEPWRLAAGKRPVLFFLLAIAVGGVFTTVRVAILGVRQAAAVEALAAANVWAAYDGPGVEDPGWYDRLASWAPESWGDFFYNVNLVIFPADGRARPEIDLECLAAFPRLKELVLSGRSHSLEDIAAIGKLTRLEVLDGLSPESDECLAGLASLNQLRSLSLNASRLSDDGIERLASLPKLCSLELDCGRFSGRGLAALQQLTFLWLSDCTVGDEATDHIGKMQELRTLRLVHTGVHSIAGLERLEHLWDLSLNGSPVTDDGLKNVKLIKSLQWLDVRYTHVTDIGVGYISEATGLARLVLGDNQVSDAGIKQLTTLVNLDHLEIDKTAVTDSGVLALACLTKLERISTDDTAVTDAARHQVVKDDAEPVER